MADQSTFVVSSTTIGFAAHASAGEPQLRKFISQLQQ
jgi:hypothetical protein